LDRIIGKMAYSVMRETFTYGFELSKTHINKIGIPTTIIYTTQLRSVKNLSVNAIKIKLMLRF